MKTRRPPVEAPIIRKRVPPWMQVRDVLMTIGAWLLIGYFLRQGLYLAYDYFRAPIFQLTATPDWAEMWGRLRGFVLLAGLLVAWMILDVALRQPCPTAGHALPATSADCRPQPRRARRVNRGKGHGTPGIGKES